MTSHRPSPYTDNRERSAQAGKAARENVPLKDHARFTPGKKRDPIGLLEEQAKTRVPDLVPVRYGRMLANPFAFYRGAALPMAADLARTPTTPLTVQLCGDAHLANFGGFGSPERRLVFDVNDFDETLPGPFEWDVKRLAASLVVAGRVNGFTPAQTSGAAKAAVTRYRESMRAFAKMSTLGVWYAHLDVANAIQELDKASRKQAKSQLAKVRTSDGRHELAKLTTVVNGQREIVSEPPLIVPVEELTDEPDDYDLLRQLVTEYASTLSADRQHLLGQFTLTRVARKVVGVGSVGTESWILLLEARDGTDPLLLQAKQAQSSVLAAYTRPSQYDNQGERVVAGQRLMQAASDIFLGWQRTAGPVDYYVRQLRDWKYSAPIAQLDPVLMARYGDLCGWTLARAHARTGDRIAMAAYLGGDDTFDQAVTAFAVGYADQNDQDHAALASAVADGRVQAVTS